MIFKISAGHSKKDVDEALSHFHTKKLTNRILLVSVFLLVLISGLIYYLNTELFELKSIKEEVPVPSVKPTNSEIELMGEAVSQDSLESCDELRPVVADSCKDRIFTKRSLANDDVELCKMVKGAFKRICFDYYYFEKSKLDKSYCDKISSAVLRERCKGGE